MIAFSATLIKMPATGFATLTVVSAVGPTANPTLPATLPTFFNQPHLPMFFPFLINLTAMRGSSSHALAASNHLAISLPLLPHPRLQRLNHASVVNPDDSLRTRSEQIHDLLISHDRLTADDARTSIHTVVAIGHDPAFFTFIPNGGRTGLAVRRFSIVQSGASCSSA